MSKYAAKLIFQNRLTKGGKQNMRRHCEERIYHFEAESAQNALKTAKAIGKNASHKYKGSLGHMVHFEFIGVKDLHIVAEYWDENQVWDDDYILVNPMERKNEIIPSDKNLIDMAGG